MSPSTDAMTEAEVRCRRFLERVEECVKSKADNIKSLTVERYAEIVARLEELSASPELRRTVADRQLLKRFQLMQVQQLKVLVKRDTRLRVVTLDRLYDTIRSAHVACGHGGRDSTYAEIQHRFANVTKEQISAFVELCQECRDKKMVKGGKRLPPNPKPPASNECNRGRCQVDFVDMQGKQDGEFRFILTYRQQLSKMVFLRATRDNVAEEAAPHLVEVFCEFGAPHLLHSTLGDDFVDQVIVEVRKLWPHCRLVRGRAALCQTDGHFKREQREIRGRVLCWMRDSHSSRWTRGLRLVQFERNSAVHRRIGRAPFEVVFGTTPTVGLASAGLRLSQESLVSLTTEEQLDEALSKVVAADPVPPADTKKANEGTSTGGRSQEERPKVNQNKVAATRASCVACQGVISGTHKCRGCQLPCHTAGPCVAPADDVESETAGVLCAFCHLRRQIQSGRVVSAGAGTKRKAERPPPWERGGQEVEPPSVPVKHFKCQRGTPAHPSSDSFQHHHHHHPHHPQQQQPPHQHQQQHHHRQSTPPTSLPPYVPRGHQFAPCGGERFLMDPREIGAPNGGFQIGYSPPGLVGASSYAESFQCLNNRA